MLLSLNLILDNEGGMLRINNGFFFGYLKDILRTNSGKDCRLGFLLVVSLLDSSISIFINSRL